MSRAFALSGWFAVAAAVAGCGARDDTLGPEDVDPPTSQSAGDGGTGNGTSTGGACELCDGQVECGHCLVQAYEDTFRCPPALPAPAGNCMDLNEVHTDQYGVAYTCYYCP